MNATELWSSTSEKLKNLFATDVYSRWIAVLKPVELKNDCLTLSVDNDFARDWFVDNYLPIVRPVVQKQAENPKLDMQIIVEKTETPSDAPLFENVKPIVPRPSPQKRSQRVKPSKMIGSLNPQFTFDEFVLGPSNSFSHAAAVAVAEKPGQAYNPLFIYGNTGLGKTHLMQAVGNRVLERPGKIVAYISTEQLLNEYIQALQDKKTMDFRERYRSVDLLLIDDIQFLAGKSQLQEEFFNTFNALHIAKKQIILTSDRPASEISGLEERLVSRFNSGLTTEMESPNFETRLAILRYKQAHVEKPLADDVLTFIAENVKSNVRALEGAMNRAMAFSNASQEPLTLEILRHILRDLLEKEKQGDVNLDMIQKTVAEYFDIRRTDLSSKDRTRSIAVPRQIAMYLCRILTHASLPEIGRSFDKTHGTVLHACQEIKNRMTVDSSLRNNVRTLVERLGQDPTSLEI